MPSSCRSSKEKESPLVLRASPSCWTPESRPGGWQCPWCRPGLCPPSRDAAVANLLFRQDPACFSNMSTETELLCRNFQIGAIIAFLGAKCIHYLDAIASPSTVTVRSQVAIYTFQLHSGATKLQVSNAVSVHCSPARILG